MGLDVSVYTDLKEAKETDDYDVCAFVIDREWEWKIKNLKNEFYFGKRADISIGYAYSSHGRFRALLYEIITGKKVTTDELFETDNYKTIPFGDFIDFADNEGTLDWEVSNKIYKDFVEHEEKAIKFLKDNNHDAFADRYLDWLEIFKIASENKGVVDFH